jgi:hypothetical protein
MPSPRRITDGVTLEMSKPKPHGKKGTSILSDCAVTSAWIPSFHCPLITIKGFKLSSFGCVNPQQENPFHFTRYCFSPRYILQVLLPIRLLHPKELVFCRVVYAIVLTSSHGMSDVSFILGSRKVYTFSDNFNHWHFDQICHSTSCWMSGISNSS